MKSPGSSAEEVFPERLLATLTDAGLLTPESADRARRAHDRAGGSMVAVVSRLGLCGEREIAAVVSRLTGKILLNPDDFPQAAIDLEVSNPQFFREAKVVPIRRNDSCILVAVADPTDAFAEQALSMAFGLPVDFAVATVSDIEDAALRLYTEALSTPANSSAGTASDIANADFTRLQEAASEAPIIRFVERIVARAAESRASDIHIEPLERMLRVRMRVDGVLRNEEPAPLSAAAGIVSRIKILARLDIAERRLPQDGAIKMNVRGREIDLRVATGPVAHGEAVVIRLLDSASAELDLGKLGFDARTLERLNVLFARPSGILLVTGPTGSGKSTTLYAGLSRLNTAMRKIVTIEDPVEYKIDGLNQFQVKPDIGLSFGKVLRSILRHDPDVIMVGEIRDGETARIAMQAALTGHLVLSTLHTNDAASAVTRLLDMGVEDYLIASTVAGVLAQRLVRVLCGECRTPTDVPVGWGIGRELRDEPQVFRAVGCGSCGGTGFRGRSVISELLIPGAELRRSILRHEESVRIRAIAIESGMQSLYDNGMDRVLDGTTTAEEIMRVAQDVI